MMTIYVLPRRPSLTLGVVMSPQSPWSRIIDSVAAPVFIKVNPPRQFLLLTQHPHDLIKILANILCQAINPLTSV